MYWLGINIEITSFEQKMKTDKPSRKQILKNIVDISLSIDIFRS